MTLCTPAVATVFAAGTSSYGISDLVLLAEDTHKFESQYLFKLIGGTPKEAPDVYAARSPVKQADNIRSPLLVRGNGSLTDVLYTPNTISFTLDIARIRRPGCTAQPGGSNHSEDTCTTGSGGICAV
jgi:hypothetical protein